MTARSARGDRLLFPFITHTHYTHQQQTPNTITSIIPSYYSQSQCNHTHTHTNIHCHSLNHSITISHVNSICKIPILSENTMRARRITPPTNTSHHYTSLHKPQSNTPLHSPTSQHINSFHFTSHYFISTRCHAMRLHMLPPNAIQCSGTITTTTTSRATSPKHQLSSS